MAKIFINNLNTPVGLLMLNELRPILDDEPSPVKVIGTLDPSVPTPRPAGIKKILHRHKPRLFRKYLLECDVIVYDLHTADLKEVEEKLSIFKTAKLEESRLIVIVSSVMVWTDTPVKTEKIEEKARDEEEVEGIEKPDLGDKDVAEGEKEEVREEAKEQIKNLVFEDSDYQTRVPHKDYARWKAIEDLALALGSKENLTVYVLCAGILYGNGEHIFEHHFKAAWLESPQKLPYLEPGDNLVPTVHVKDLARIVKFVVDTKPETKYIFAVDNTKDKKQVTIIQAISNGIGTGEIHPSKPTGAYWELFLSINLWIKPSTLLIPEEEAAPPIEWHALEGILGNIHKLNSEFNLKRGLRPIKLFVSGPPASGKTHFSRILSSEYNIPHIKIQDLLDECVQKHSEYGPIIEKHAKANQRLSSELLAEIFRWKLHMNHCRNRGYILDGYPRSYAEAQQLFMKLKKTEEVPGDEEGEPKPKEYELDSEILPKNVVVFRAPTHFLMDRMEKIQNFHQEFRLERMLRRLKEYRENNEISEKSVFDYFSEMNNEVFECECKDDEIETIENLKIYIEREGRPHNFLPSIEEMVEKRRKFIEDRDFDKMMKLKKEEENLERIKNEKWEHRSRKAQERLESIKEELHTASKAQTIPLRKYLMDNIMPALAEALIHVCKVMPEDPVDYVAELMYAHSKTVRK